MQSGIQYKSQRCERYRNTAVIPNKLQRGTGNACRHIHSPIVATWIICLVLSVKQTVIWCHLGLWESVYRFMIKILFPNPEFTTPGGDARPIWAGQADDFTVFRLCLLIDKILHIETNPTSCDMDTCSTTSSSTGCMQIKTSNRTHMRQAWAAGPRLCNSSWRVKGKSDASQPIAPLMLTSLWRLEVFGAWSLTSYGKKRSSDGLTQHLPICANSNNCDHATTLQANKGETRLYRGSECACLHVACLCHVQGRAD